MDKNKKLAPIAVGNGIKKQIARTYKTRMEEEENMLIIESIERDSIEWGISFAGSNPSAKDYFAVKDKETAFRLKDRLTIPSPITFDEPFRFFIG